MASGWTARHNTIAVVKAMDNFEKDTPKAVNKALEKLAAKILRTAKELAPVDTGALRRSGRIVIEEGGSHQIHKRVLVGFGGMGTGVDYAAYQEFGTSYFSGRFFLLRAVRKHAPELVRFSKEYVKDAWTANVAGTGKFT